MNAILTQAGFLDICLESLHQPMGFGPDADEAFDFISSLTNGMREGLDDDGREAALAALRSTIASHTTRDGVTFQSASWIIQARRA